MSYFGASLRDRAGRVTPQAATRLGHPATIPCAEIDLNLGGYTLGIAPPPRVVVTWPPRPVMIRTIQELVAAYFGIPLIEMWSQRRARDVARPRQVAMYLCKRFTHHSLPEIGRRFGGRDHTTVIHAVRQIERLMGLLPELAEDVAILSSEMKA